MAQPILINLEDVVYSIFGPVLSEISEKPKVYLKDGILQVVFAKGKYIRRSGPNLIKKNISFALHCVVSSLGQDLKEVQVGYMKKGNFERLSKIPRDWPLL